MEVIFQRIQLFSTRSAYFIRHIRRLRPTGSQVHRGVQQIVGRKLTFAAVCFSSVYAARDSVRDSAYSVRDSAHDLAKNMEGQVQEVVITKEADALYEQNEVNKLYAYLKEHKTKDSAEIQWRYARAACDKAKSMDDKTARKELMYEAFAAAEKALSLDDKNFACHKWYAILLDYIGEYEGTKERISKAFKIREHFEKAIELNPKDATSVHLLGYWCFVFADMPWYQHKVAGMIFATPPTSTYQEALKYFLDAEKIDPGFYSTNLLMIGKTYLRLKDNELAKQYLIRARDDPVRTEDDKKAHKEAVELLQTLGVK